MSSIFQRSKDAPFTYQWRDEFGKPHMKSTGIKNRLLAEAKQKVWDENLAKFGTVESPEEKAQKTWEEFYPEYEARYETAHAEKSLIKLRNAVAWFKKLVKPGRMADITKEDGEDFKTLILKEKDTRYTKRKDDAPFISPKSCNVMLQCLKPLFSAAHAWGYIPTDPFYDLEPFPIFGKEPSSLADAECEAILVDAMKHEAEDVAIGLMIAQDTGLRRGEIQYIRLKDIDLEEGFLKVAFHWQDCVCERCSPLSKAQREACLRIQKPLWHPKGKKERLIPLTPRLLLALREEKKKGNKGCLFTCEESRWTRIMRRVRKRLNLQGKITIHTFRHAFVSDLDRAGVRGKVIKDIVGHSSGKEALGGITDHYNHATKAELKLEFQKFIAYRQASEARAMQSKFNIL